jgi:hypothetical protein
MTSTPELNTSPTEISFRDNARTVLPDVLEAFYGHASLIGTSPEALHELRIAAKRLRYSMEFFESCYGKRLARYLDSIRELQELLGNVHDCDVMIEFLGKRQIKLAARLAPESEISGIKELIVDYERQRAELAEEFTLFWSRRFARGFKTRLLRVILNEEKRTTKTQRDKEN